MGTWKPLPEQLVVNTQPADSAASEEVLFVKKLVLKTYGFCRRTRLASVQTDVSGDLVARHHVEAAGESWLNQFSQFKMAICTVLDQLGSKIRSTGFGTVDDAKRLIEIELQVTKCSISGVT